MTQPPCASASRLPARSDLHPFAAPGSRAMAVAAAFWIQGAVLAIWAHQAPKRACFLVAGFTAVALWQLRPAASRPTAARLMTAIGGAGMAVGAWADSSFTTPQCLCCIYDGSQTTWRIWGQLLTSASVVLMLLLPLGFGWWERRGQSSPPPPVAPMAAESLGMLLGMGLAGWAGSFAVRRIALGKLEVGFALMVFGMVAGGSIAGLLGPQRGKTGAGLPAKKMTG